MFERESGRPGVSRVFYQEIERACPGTRRADRTTKPLTAPRPPLDGRIAVAEHDFKYVSLAGVVEVDDALHPPRSRGTSP
jgi:hypothetical protein